MSDVDPLSALGLSALVAASTVIAGAPIAIGLGWLLARARFPGKWLLSAAIMTPLVLPPVVTGFLLLDLLGPRTLLGGTLQRLGIEVAFAPAGAVIAAAVVGLPLYVLAARSAFEAADPRYEAVSRSLGLGRVCTFRRVTLPLALPGIAAGAVLAFARALGEFGATVVLAGNIEGRTRTLSLAIYTLLESPNGLDDARTLAWLSIGLSLGALLGYEAFTRWQRRRLEVDDVW